MCIHGAYIGLGFMAFMALTAGHLGANLQIAWKNFGSGYSRFFFLFIRIFLLSWGFLISSSCVGRKFILCCPWGRKYVPTYFICVQSKPMGQLSSITYLVLSRYEFYIRHSITQENIKSTIFPLTRFDLKKLGMFKKMSCFKKCYLTLKDPPL